MPDAKYYEDNPWFPQSGETWITHSNPFDLQVLGATQGKTYVIKNVTLYISLLENEYLNYKDVPDSFVTIEDRDPSIDFSRVLYYRDFIYGIPRELSPHGIYPTYYASVHLPDLLVGAADEIVYNYNPDETGFDSGDIQEYQVSFYNKFKYVHFDLSGDTYDVEGNKLKEVFAPYSHDADDLPTGTIPEPATLILMGTGILGFVLRKRLK
jgi:hypothetical protein